MENRIYEKKLFNFLTDTCELKGKDFINAIQASRIETIIKEEVLAYDKDAIDYDVLEADDEKKINAYLGEIAKIIKCSEEKNIKVIFMKGIFLAAQLYDNVITRRGRDADVLIDIQDFFEFESILVEMGYVRRGQEYTLENYKELLEENHAVYDRFVDNVWCTFEVHTSILNPSYIYIDKTKDYIESAKKIKCCGMNPYFLDIDHNIVFLLMHYYKHFSKRFHFLMFGGDVAAKLFNLHDMAILISKYRDRIDWKKVLELCIEMKVCKFVLYTIQCIEEVYGDIFNSELKKGLQDKIDDSYVQITYQHGMGKFMWLSEEVMGNHEITLSDYIKGCFAENFTGFLKYGKGEAYLPVELENAVEKNQIIASLKAKIEEEFLSVQMVIKNKKIAHLTKQDLIKVNRKPKVQSELVNLSMPIVLPEEKDGIELLFIFDDHVIHKGFTLYKDEDDQEYKLYYFSKENGGEILEKENGICEYTILHCNDETTMTIRFNHEMVGIHLDTPFMANIAGNIADPDTGNLLFSVPIFENSGKNLWDFRNIPCVK